MIYETATKEVVLVQPQARLNNAAVTVSGVDRPGVTARLFSALAGADGAPTASTTSAQASSSPDSSSTRTGSAAS